MLCCPRAPSSVLHILHLSVANHWVLHHASKIPVVNRQEGNYFFPQVSFQNFLFSLDLVFLSRFRLTAKLRGKYREFPDAPSPLPAPRSLPYREHPPAAAVPPSR